MILGQHLGQQLCDALDLPKYTIGFTLRARVGELVTIECEYVPEDRLQTGRILSELAQYNLVPADAAARKVRGAGEVTNYDAWKRERTERAHAEYMARTSRHLPCDWDTEQIARYMGVPL